MWSLSLSLLINMLLGFFLFALVIFFWHREEIVNGGKGWGISRPTIGCLNGFGEETSWYIILFIYLFIYSGLRAFNICYSTFYL